MSTAIAVGAIFPIGALPAHADEAPVKVETAAWFWATQTSGTTPAGGIGMPQLPADKSGVPDGDLAVAFRGEKEKLKNGEEVAKPDKETYLAWDIYFVPEGSFVDSFTFTMFLDPKATQVVPPEVAVPGQTPRGGQPSLIACVPTIGFGEGFGEPYSLKPEDDCSNQIFGMYDAAAKSYTFDATTYAQDWVDGMDNFGLGIRPVEDAQDPFQLVFKGAADVKATISYTPAEDEGEEPFVPVAPEVFVPLPPAPQTGTATTVVPVQPAPQPAPQAAPVAVVQKPRQPVVIQNAAASPLTSSRGLNGTFWLALLGGVGLIGVTSLILGDPLEASAGSHRVRTSGRHRLNAPANAPVRSNRAIRPRIV